MNFNLNRRIKLQSRTVTQNENGQKVESWADVADVWCRRRDINGAEFFESEKPNAEATTEFTIRHRSDVDVLHRVVEDGNNFDILDIKALGRSRYLALMATALV